MKHLTLVIIVALGTISSCTKEEVTPRSYPRVNTLDITNITTSGALFSGEIKYASVPILDHGFLWSTQGDALFTNSDKISLGAKNGTGSFEAQCDRALQGGKTYYVRAYAISEDHSVYGDVVSFVSMGSKPPTLKDFYPTLASWEDTVIIVGENFSSVLLNNIVKFNDVQANVLSASKDTLHVKVPFDLTEEFASISVSRTGNVSTLEKKFQLRAPVLTSITPGSATPGSKVVIAGQYLLSPKTKVFFNNTVGVVTKSSSKSLECTVPVSMTAGSVTLKVVTGSGNLFGTIPLQIN